eukprot:CAMPEP_0204347408 /NCGR_PEP_ID=MMETSP0469-20131031/27930_1 /ASSEMBLY_ACC=CAM_ASM_000384 /TAXON_ID=2969 /ORGANISM="Oxyrrhis marina" /LENGTH=210 /DNA_ID=CAMNT_0051333211 /DNA_START=18 /DNA_END=650 /DNA_ORIENTATION=-
MRSIFAVCLLKVACGMLLHRSETCEEQVAELGTKLADCQQTAAGDQDAYVEAKALEKDKEATKGERVPLLRGQIAAKEEQLKALRSEESSLDIDTQIMRESAVRKYVAMVGAHEPTAEEQALAAIECDKQKGVAERQLALCEKRNEIQKTRRDKSVQSYQRMVTAHDDTASELVDRIAALDREIAVIGARNAVKARRIEELKPHSDYKPE